MAAELCQSIREEIAHVEAEVEAAKRAAKDCTTEEQRWETSTKLRQLHTRLKELQTNMEKATD